MNVSHSYKNVIHPGKYIVKQLLVSFYFLLEEDC
jgi:hypothetical protein